MDANSIVGGSDEPFGNEAVRLSGCGKPAVIGCLVLLVVVGLGLLALVWKARDLLGYAVREYRAVVVEALPDGFPDEDRERLEAAFDGALQAIASGELNPAALQELQRALASPPRPGELLEPDEIRELTEALESIPVRSGGSRRSTSPRDEARFSSSPGPELGAPALASC